MRKLGCRRSRDDPRPVRFRTLLLDARSGQGQETRQVVKGPYRCAQSLGQWDWGIARPSDEEITEHLAQVAASKGTLAIGRTDTFRLIQPGYQVPTGRSRRAADPKLADRLTCLPGWRMWSRGGARNTRDDVWRVWLGRLMETQQSGVDPSEIGQSFVTEKGERLGEMGQQPAAALSCWQRLAEERVGLLEQVPGWVLGLPERRRSRRTWTSCVAMPSGRARLMSLGLIPRMASCWVGRGK